MQNLAEELKKQGEKMTIERIRKRQRQLKSESVIKTPAYIKRKTSIYQSKISDNNNYEQWKDGGSLDMAKRAEIKYQEMLKGYQIPKLDNAIDAELIAFINKRKQGISNLF